MISTVTISEDIVEKCKAFAEERIKSSEHLYRLRGEDSIEKMRQDIITGAMGEFAVYDYLKTLGISPTEPDLSIHTERQKSFAADLKSEKGSFHIKSQTVAATKKYGASWLFQVSDRLLVLPSENEYVVFCLVDGTTVQIQAIVSNIDLVEAEITKKPKVPKYAHTKHAIYLEDVLNCGIPTNRIKELL